MGDLLGMHQKKGSFIGCIMHFSPAADAMPFIYFFDDTMTLLSFSVASVEP
jgi:hypothetical protein